MLHSKLFNPKYFPTGALLPIRIPLNSIGSVVEKKQSIGGFHKEIGELTETTVGPLTISASPEDKEKMFAFVTKGKSGLIVFGRKGLTNFAETDVELLSEAEVKKQFPDATAGVNAKCSEQLFKLMCAGTHADNQHFESVVTNILLAPKPQVAKAACLKLEPFNSEYWDSLSPQAMYQATILRCTHKKSFDMFKQCLSKLRETGVETFTVIEANDDDKWGINRFTKPFLADLCKNATEEEDLIATATKLFDGKNQLGTVLTDFMLVIEGVEYEDYMAALEGVKFVEVV